MRQKTCLKETCLAAWGKHLVAEKKKAEAKKWQQEKKEIKAKHMKFSDWLALLQVVFNNWVRERDKGKLCISCDSVIYGTGNASHFFSVGSYPNLRFHEDNCHLSCIQCNKHLGGNLVEYGIRLPSRIGEDRYKELMEQRNVELHLTLPEVQAMISDYKQRIKKLKEA